MNGIDAEELVRRALNAGLLTTAQVEMIWDELGSRQAPLTKFIMFVFQGGYLTNFQIARLTEDRRDGFFLGAYKVLYMLRAEQLARVYRGVHRTTQHEVDVKVLRIRFSDNASAQEEFRREARQLGCKIETQDGRFYMVLDGSQN